MGFTVKGQLNGEPYRVRWADGDVSGSEAVRTRLLSAMGEWFLATPTGPSLRLDLANPASVVAALRELTILESVAGEVTALLPPDEPDVVY